MRRNSAFASLLLGSAGFVVASMANAADPVIAPFEIDHAPSIASAQSIGTSADTRQVDETGVPLTPLPLPAPEHPDSHRTPERTGWVRRMLVDWPRRTDRVAADRLLFAKFRNNQDAPSDSLLTSRCRAILLGEPSLKGVWIHVTTKEGVIHLRGSVPMESIRSEAETVAGRTPGAKGIRNELVVQPNLQEKTQASYRAATLIAPKRLDGSDLRTAAQQTISPVPTDNVLPAVALQAPVAMASRDGLPEVRTYVIERPMVTAASLAPVWSNPLSEQRSAKTSVQPPVLPSGLTLAGASGRPGVIPAPTAAEHSSATVPYHQPPTRTQPVTASVPQNQGLAADIRAILSMDPRASELTHSLRGSEVRLAGSIRTPEDLYDLSRKLNSLPGVDFVSFEDVQFQF